MREVFVTPLAITRCLLSQIYCWGILIWATLYTCRDEQ